jgi:hypothetical protein
MAAADLGPGMGVLMMGPVGSSAKKGADDGKLSYESACAATAAGFGIVALASDRICGLIDVAKRENGRRVLDVRNRDAMADLVSVVGVDEFNATEAAVVVTVTFKALRSPLSAL